MRLSALIVQVAMLLALCACGGADHSALPAPVALAQTTAPFTPTPALPLPLGLDGAKAVRDGLGLIRGDAFAAGLPRSSVVDYDSSASFRPYPLTPGALSNNAYCIYRVPVDDSGPLRFTPNWFEPPPAGRFFIAFGNISSNRWDWQTPDDPAAAITLNNYADYIQGSGPGTVLIALLMTPAATVDGPHITAELDFFQLDVQPASGWRNLELFSGGQDGVSFSQYGIQRAVPFIVDGKPAIAFTSGNYDVGYDSQIALSSTADGANLDDWDFIDLAPGGQYAFESIASLPGGTGIVWRNAPGSPAPEQLHYGFSSDLASGFSDEVVHTALGVYNNHLASIGGLPGISFTHDASPGDGSVQPYYASSDAIQGGNWTVGPVSDTQTIGSAVTGGICPPLEFGGKPLLGYFGFDSGTGYKFRVAAANKLNPAGAADWTVHDLGDGADALLQSVMLNGKPTFVSGVKLYISTDEYHFWTYTLSGADPAIAADWSAVHFDALDLGNEEASSFIVQGNELLFAIHSLDSSSSYLNGSLETATVWRSTGPANDPAAWSQDELVYGAMPRQLTLFDLSGGLAAVQIYADSFGASLERRRARLIWSVYVP